jgi:hypothetical protein
LTVQATEGEVAGIIPNHGSVFFFPVAATAEQVQVVLEGQVGAGNVIVRGGPGDAAGSKPYRITFTGSLAGEDMGPVEMIGLVPNPGTESVHLKVVEKGGSGGEIWLTAINVGGAATDGSRVAIRDTLPAGLVATRISGFDTYRFNKITANAPPLQCSTPPILECTTTEPVLSGDPLVVRIKVKAEEGLTGAVNHAMVSGGGAEFSASAENVASVESTPASAGIAAGSTIVAASNSQAGGHPNLTTGFTLNTKSVFSSAGSLKDVHVDLPPGLVGNTVGMPTCSLAKALQYDCARDTIVGIATVFLEAFPGGPSTPLLNPVFNIAPSPGEPAAFVFTVSGVAPVRVDTSLRSNGDYGVRVTVGNINEIVHTIASYVTIWGVPADHQGPGSIHTAGYRYSQRFEPNQEGLGGPGMSSRVPLLSNPTQCSTSLSAGVEVDSWEEPGVFDGESASLGMLSGCERLSFAGSLSVLPDTLVAGAPAGYVFDLSVPQHNDPDLPNQPNVRRVVSTLPMGTVISPSAAWGLVACSDAQFGLHSGVPGDCPREAIVGSLQVRTPALPLPLTGDVFLASPECGVCSPNDAQDGRMVRLFLQLVGEGESGIVVKLEGTGRIDQQTGQLTVTFDENPQLPFSDLKLTLGGGPRATLANPRQCGPASARMGLTPWSSPFTSEISPSYTFEINQGCIAPKFAPSFVAGATNIQAGEDTPFTLSFGREDSDEFLNGLQLRMPAGLLGSLSNVPLCHEPQAASGTCGDQSLIGHTQVLTGPGADPFLVTGGKVFLTDGYHGAPFGLSIVVPAKAGPYTLSGTTGDGTVVVRAAINVDPHSAALTVTSDPLPTALDGIPLQLKVVNVTIDRPGFTFNPTSCAKMSIEGSISSKESAGALVSSPFQVTNCAGLGFKPKFGVTTSGRTSRSKGASLDAKLSYPTGPKLANIAKVKVSLPKQLPSRLTTLQKACPAATFDSDPARCPAASVVGVARASTPIIPVGLSGPVYFVSHGGEAFPNLIVVLQGYGVRVDLVGDTFINKAGITSSTFRQVPDVPVSSFELYLPQGAGSALAANGNLCKSKLTMPTVFVAQNGAELRQSTKIAVTGCAKSKVKKASRARRSRRGRAASKHRSGYAAHATKAGDRNASAGRGN